MFLRVNFFLMKQGYVFLCVYSKNGESESFERGKIRVREMLLLWKDWFIGEALLWDDVCELIAVGLNDEIKYGPLILYDVRSRYANVCVF